MSVPHPGGDPNANLYAQLKRDVLDRVPFIVTVEFLPDDVEAKQLHAIFDPARLAPPTGPESPELDIMWYRQTPADWFRVNYSDPNTGFHAGWHQDEDHPDLGRAHFSARRRSPDVHCLSHKLVTNTASHKPLLIAKETIAASEVIEMSEISSLNRTQETNSSNETNRTSKTNLTAFLVLV